MDTNFISNVTSSAYSSAYTAKTQSGASQDAAAKTAAAAQKTDTADTGVIYEKSSDTASETVTKKTDYALVAKLKADAEQRTAQLRSLVEKMMTQQGNAIGTADSIWSFLASGNYTVDEAARAQAQADIAEDGYWGVEQTSDRILDFAKALSGNDPEKADLLLDAFKQGFEEATKSRGQELPDISQRTYDAVVEKFEQWKNSATTEAAGTQA